MKKTLIWTGTVIGAAAFLSLAFNFINTSMLSEKRVIAVSGECLTTAPKDRTAITIRVQTLNDSAAVSMKQATNKIAEITTYLKTIDVKMQTTQFDSYEKTEWDQAKQKSVKLGIETSIAMEVSADKIETIEKVLGKFAGSENVYSENLRMFTSAETLKPIMEKCLGDAVANARTRAESLAFGDNKKVGKILDISYTSNNNANIRSSNFMARNAKMEATSFDMAGGIMAKDTDVSVTVSATFQIR